MSALFEPTLDTLPREIAIFPLGGALLLPTGGLPLNIFEPRYLAMIDDALATHRMIGMVQPTDRNAGAGIVGCAASVYPVGCAGRITEFNETEDGRYLVTLTGICRFTIARELAPHRGYRRVVPEFERFGDDLVPERNTGPVDRDRLLGALKSYFERNNLTTDWEAIEDAPDDRLVTALAMTCPFDPMEKQALLEARDLTGLTETMITLLEIGESESSVVH